MGIGGEYAAINSAIDEMIPARYRGRVDLAVNGTYWAGAILGTLATLYLLNNLAPTTSWRLAFLVGPVLALVIIYVRRQPAGEPALADHARPGMKPPRHPSREIEDDVAATKGELPPVDDDQAHRDHADRADRLPGPAPGAVHALPEPVDARRGPDDHAVVPVQRDLLHLRPGAGVLLPRQPNDTGYYFLAFAAGNLLGPLTIGRLFDTIGRRKMISGTYLLAGVLLVITAQLFKAGALNATTQTLCWAVIFFFASAGASAGYLTVSEIFPLEVRAKAIAVFFAIAQCFGFARHAPVRAPDRHRQGPELAVLGLPASAPGAMILGGLVAAFLGVDAEGKSLEDVARPLGVIGQAAGGDLPDRRFHHLTVDRIAPPEGGPLASGPPSGHLCIQDEARPPPGPACPRAGRQHGEIITANSLGNST